MRKFNTIIVTSLLCLQTQAFAETPVVEDSQNYTVSEDFRDNYMVQGNQPRLQGGLSKPLSNDTSTKSANSLVNDIYAMQRELQKLHGQIDLQNNEITQLKKQQRNLYAELGKELPSNTQELVTAKQTTLNSTTEGTSYSNNEAVKSKTLNSSTTIRADGSLDEQASYAAAYSLVKDKKFSEAITAMRSFIVNYPNSIYVANAHYWLGELYLVKHENQQAIDEFISIIDNYANSSKVPAAMVKLGFTYADLQEYDKARIQLQAVIDNYPDTTTAQLAKNRLDSLL